MSPRCHSFRTRRARSTRERAPASASGTAALITGAGTQTAGNSQSLTITAEDSWGNTATTYNGDRPLTFSGANSSSNPVTVPTIRDKTGTAQNFGTATTVTFVAGVNAAGGSMKLYRAETAVIAVSDGSNGTALSDRLTVVVAPAAASKFVYTTAAQTLIAGVCSPGTLA